MSATHAANKENQPQSRRLLRIELGWVADDQQDGKTATMGMSLLRTVSLPTSMRLALAVDRQAFDALGWDRARLDQEWANAWRTLDAWDSQRSRVSVAWPTQAKKGGFLSLIKKALRLHPSAGEAAARTSQSDWAMTHHPLVNVDLLSSQLTKKTHAVLRGYAGLPAEEQLRSVARSLAQILNAAAPQAWVLENPVPAEGMEQQPAVRAWIERQDLQAILHSGSPVPGTGSNAPPMGLPAQKGPSPARRL